MRNVTFWVILLIFWIAGASYCYVCEIRNDCGCNEPDYAIPAFNVEDGDFKALDDNNLYYGYSDANLVVPNCIKRELKKVVRHLNKNKSRHMVLQGMYTLSENGNASLGLARADSLKTFLIDLGADPNQISISFKSVPELTFDEENTRTYGAIEFIFSDLLNCTSDLSEEDLAQLIEKLKTPHHVYYESGSSIMDYTPELHKFFSDLAYFVCKYPDSKIFITGHTDSTGDADMNMQLSIDRANNLKAYLIKKNIPEEAFEIDGKGLTEPAGDNETDEGRALNRRVEIKLIY
ncbi:MAG: OmpA family protein [Bacteroidota bacterium]|jgi:OOP family OmpA-OmpF porin